MDSGTDRQVAERVEVAWQRQSVWSQAANHLKGDLTRWRAIALGLTIAGAVLATLAVQVAELSSLIGKGLAWAGAVAVGLVPVVRGTRAGWPSSPAATT
jgi:drug/metabolite transporter (DMT)-like permease